MEEEPHRYEDAVGDNDPDYTTPSGVGDDTTDGAAEGATTDDGGARTDGSQPKRSDDHRPCGYLDLGVECVDCGRPTGAAPDS